MSQRTIDSTFGGNSLATSPFKRRSTSGCTRVRNSDRASFSGTWDRFEESWVYPRPTRGAVPIALADTTLHNRGIPDEVTLWLVGRLD